MSKRETRRAEGISAAEAEETVGMSLEDLARRGYGLPDTGLMSVGGDRMVARAMDIFAIAPDPTQPRREHIPSSVRARWDGKDMGALFQAWMTLLAEEKLLTYEQVEAWIGTVLRGEETLPEEVYQNPPESRVKVGVMERSLLAVARLAADIRSSGLNHPIEIVTSAGGSARIQFGERRWLAYHLLHLAFQDDRWARIPAVTGKGVDVWRQASENTQRADLNAIGKARQLALLLMDVHRQEGAVFQPYEAFEHDRHYYAQVADGQTWRIPRGLGERFMTAMGLKIPGQLRDHRRLLTLPDAVWTLADDYGLTEHWLNETRRSIQSDRLFYQVAMQEAIRAGYTVAVATVAVRDELPYEEPAMREVGRETIDMETGEIITPAEPMSEAPPPEPLREPERARSEAEHLFQVGDAVEVLPGALPTIRSLKRGVINSMGRGQALIALEDGALSWCPLGRVRPGSAETRAWADAWKDTQRERDEARQILEHLHWAYQRAQAYLKTGTGSPWYSARGVGRMTEWLNDMVRRGWLEGKSDRENTSDGDLFYRIAAAGCQKIGEAVIEWPATKRRAMKLAGTDERRAIDVLLAITDMDIEQAREQRTTSYIEQHVSIVEALLARIRGLME